MKFFLGIALLLTGQLVFSQTEKGTLMLATYIGSGTLSDNKNNNYYSNVPGTFRDEDKKFSISAGPSILYFVHDNLAIGATLEVGYTTEKYYNYYTNPSSHTTTKSHSFTISLDPEIRKYFGKPGSKGQPWINIFGGVNTNPARSKYIRPIALDDTKNTYNGWNAGAGVGYSHYFNKHIALQYFINFKHLYAKTRSTETIYDPTTPGVPIISSGYTKTTINNNSINFGVGLQIHLSKKG
jgi:hypothetical protein